MNSHQTCTSIFACILCVATLACSSDDTADDSQTTAPADDPNQPVDDVVPPGDDITPPIDDVIPPGDDVNPPVDVTPPEPELIGNFNINGGYDGVNTFTTLYSVGVGSFAPLDDESGVFELIPVTINPDDLVVAADNPDLVSITRLDLVDEWFYTYEVVSLGVGETTITATYQDLTSVSNVTIVGYDPEVTAIGEQRYNAPVDPNGADRQPCSNCHGPDKINHSPTYSSYWDDTQLLSLIQDGTVTEVFEDGFEFEYSPEPDGIEHRWNLSPEEAEGIVAYMRSLDPVY